MKLWELFEVIGDLYKNHPEDARNDMNMLRTLISGGPVSGNTIIDTLLSSDELVAECSAYLKSKGVNDNFEHTLYEWVAYIDACNATDVYINDLKNKYDIVPKSPRRIRIPPVVVWISGFVAGFLVGNRRRSILQG